MATANLAPVSPGIDKHRRGLEGLNGDRGSSTGVGSPFSVGPRDNLQVGTDGKPNLRSRQFQGSQSAPFFLFLALSQQTFPLPGVSRAVEIDVGAPRWFFCTKVCNGEGRRRDAA